MGYSYGSMVVGLITRLHGFVWGLGFRVEVFSGLGFRGTGP